MAKIYNFHIYSDEEEPNKIEEFENNKIKIASELGEQTSSQLKKIFQDDDNIAIANEINPPGDKGGGGFGIFPLMDWFNIGLSVTIILATKGFFDELGRGLAKKLLSVLFEKNRPTKLTIESEGKVLEIIVPSKTKLENVNNIEHFLNNFDKIQGGKCVYSSETKTFVFIEKYENLEDYKNKG